MTEATYFHINTDLSSYKKSEHYKKIKNPFPFWLKNGYAYLTPQTDKAYRSNLKKLQVGSIVFAHESGVGFVAVGTVIEAWDGETYKSEPDLYPPSIQAIYKIRVDWDTSINCSNKKLTKAGFGGFRQPITEIVLTSVTSFLTTLIVNSNYVARRDAQAAAKNEDEEEKKLESILSNNTLSETEKMALVKLRLNQGLFRKRLQLIEPKCRLTGIANPDLLRASHIKPWRSSDRRERLDENNGLFLSPHVDHLFDKYLITFTENGDLLVSSSIEKKVLTAWGLPYQVNVGSFNAEQAKYLEHHRDEFFKRNDVFASP